MLLPTLICCIHCGQRLDSTSPGYLRCACGATGLQHQDGMYVTQSLDSLVDIERVVRDRQATEYLQHAKFPTQIRSFENWLVHVQQSVSAGSQSAARPIALDLGCGPGPYTQQLLQAGYDVLAIDTSTTSLAVNAESCRHPERAGEACFVQFDLNRLALLPASVDLVLMADFMQHLPGRQARERLLQAVALAMKPGARFYLSFFNLNIKHYLKGDVHGAFADGAIRYERLTLPNMLAELPATLMVERTEPLNIFYSAALDRLVTRIPGAFLLARMAAISGSRAGVGGSA